MDESMDVRGVRVHFRDGGAGPPLIFAHCSSASHRQWEALYEPLEERYRVLAPDLIGYGKSDPWPAERPFDLDADVEILAALTDRVEGSVHFVGHSYGAAMALEAMLRAPERVRGATLIEPVSFPLLRSEGREREWREIQRVSRSIRSAVSNGRLSAAARAYMGFWIGPVKWLLTPRKVRSRIVASVPKVAQEFAGVDAMSRRAADYGAIRAPVLLFVGQRTTRPARAVVEILANALPDVHVREIPKAGHMSPFTHRDALFAAIEAHVDDLRPAAGSGS